MAITLEELQERFWKRVNKTNECWIWQGAGHTRSDHGMFGYNSNGQNITLYAHRFAYQQLVGEIPGDLVLDHLCCNPRCVNPSHLEPVTRAENTCRARRMMTTCKRGHDLANAYVNKKNGHRSCRDCNNYRRRKHE